jgi:exodeoxyribonuclease VII small subunit
MPKSKEPMKFEDQLRRLEAIVEQLDKKEVALEDSLKLYEEGVRLTQACQKTLEEARLRVEKLSKKSGTLLPLDGPESE